MAQSKAAAVLLSHGMDDIPVMLFTDERGGLSPRDKAIKYARETDNATLERRAAYWFNDASTPMQVNVVTFDEFGQAAEVFNVRSYYAEDDE
jgi:hypothetical protein